MLKPGKLVRLHPASDWFIMRGEKLATVLTISPKIGRMRVQGQRSGRRRKTHVNLTLTD